MHVGVGVCVCVDVYCVCVRVCGWVCMWMGVGVGVYHYLIALARLCSFGMHACVHFKIQFINMGCFYTYIHRTSHQTLTVEEKIASWLITLHVMLSSCISVCFVRIAVKAHCYGTDSKWVSFS